MTCPRPQLASGTFGVQPQDCLILSIVVLSSCHCTSSPVELECSLCLTFIFLSFRMPLWLTTPTRIHSDPQGSPQMAPYPDHLPPRRTPAHKATFRALPLAPPGKPTLLHGGGGEVEVAQLCRLFATPWTILQARILEWVAFPFSRGPNPGSNPGFPHCGLILYQLSYEGSLYYIPISSYKL